VLNSYQDKCLYIIKWFDTFSIKHIPREENRQVNQLAQQASGYVVSQGVFWVASVSLVEHRYALRSKGKLILEDSGRLWDKEKLIPGKAKWLPGNRDLLSRKIELESGRIESEPGKTELSSGKEKPVRGNTNQLPGNIDWLSGKVDPETKLSSGKVEPGLSYRCRLWEELEPILGEEDNEESITKKSESENIGSPIDEEKMEPMKKCIRDPGKIGGCRF
jgi:hypothetical protein